MDNHDSLRHATNEIEPVGYIGVDFGTSNSHFAFCYVDGNLTAEPICLGGKVSQCTCVLWKEPAQSEEDIITYGEQALQEWSNRDPTKRLNYRFAAGFKPDILSSERARRDAWAYLRKAFLAIKDSSVIRAIGASAGMPVVVGVPAEISDEQKRITAEVTELAGFGRVECVAEPLGALAFHLAKKDVNAAEARDGVVVVDFGGGTLDVALVDAKGLRVPWGDPLLGGRFFDDLFYQWLLDQNPGLTIDPHDLLYVWQVTCRELKEDFSNRWAQRGPTDDFQKRVPVGDRFWRFKGASVADFLQRAANYRPSPVAESYFRDVGGKLTRFSNGERIDLVSWIRRTLTPNPNLQLPRRFSRVILTGGSSQWPFMKDLASEVFGVLRENIICSACPEITIGSGLAIYNVLRRNYEKKCVFLRSEKSERTKEFLVAVAARKKTFSEDVSTTAVNSLMARVETIFLEWYHNGGTLADVETQVDVVCKNFEPEIVELVKTKTKVLAKDLLRILRDHVKKWLAEHDIQREVEQYVPPEMEIDTEDTMKGGGVTGRIAENLALKAMAAVTGVVVICVAIIKGKIVVALFLAHPGFGIIALLASVLGFTAVNAAIAKQVKAYHWGKISLLKYDLKALHQVLSEQKLKKELSNSREEAITTLSTEIEKPLASLL